VVTLKKADLKTVAAFAEKHDRDAPHSRQVAHLSLLLFQDLKPVHLLSGKERRLLYAAAVLHDTGLSLSQKRHNKAGMRFILNDTKLPLTQKERTLAALIVRYHRGRLPAKSHALYAAQSKTDRRRVRILAGILRVADGLDASHRGAVASVKAEISPETVMLVYTAKHRALPEERHARKKSDLFCDVFSRGLELRWKKVS
jgi:exopolyphosphatase/guanosine-5'-triphosphate,3'-diphosphate pyrophosphatase